MSMRFCNFSPLHSQPTSFLFFCSQNEVFPKASTVSSLLVFDISLIFIIVKNLIIKFITSVVKVPMLQPNVS